MDGFKGGWMTGLFCLKDCITMTCSPKWFMLPPAQLMQHVSKLGGHNGHPVKLHTSQQAMYCTWGEEFNSASLCVLLSEPRHIAIIQLVQAYQSAESQVNPNLYCPLKGNVVCSLSVTQSPHKYTVTQLNRWALLRHVLIFLEAQVELFFRAQR